MIVVDLPVFDPLDVRNQQFPPVGVLTQASVQVGLSPGDKSFRRFSLVPSGHDHPRFGRKRRCFGFKREGNQPANRGKGRFGFRRDDLLESVAVAWAGLVHGPAERTGRIVGTFDHQDWLDAWAPFRIGAGGPSLGPVNQSLGNGTGRKCDMWGRIGGFFHGYGFGVVYLCGEVISVKLWRVILIPSSPSP